MNGGGIVVDGTDGFENGGGAIRSVRKRGYAKVDSVGGAGEGALKQVKP